MRRARLLRSTPFRLALTFALLFVVAFILAGLIVYQLLRVDLSDHLDETVKGTYSVVAATYADGDLEDLVAAVNSHAALSDSNEQLFSLVDSSGRRIAGDFTAPARAMGFSSLGSEELQIPAKGTYRTLSGTVGDNVLTVAHSYSETEELEQIIIISFGWGTLIIFGLAVVGGVLLASSVQRRLDSIGSTMVDVSHGNLDARIPLIGRGDDIDEVSGQVNSALDRLSALVGGMKQVSANIAHDLKTPLNRLQIILEGAGEKLAAGEALGAELDEARDECLRINGTFEALLRIAQIEAGARKARFATVVLQDVVDDIGEAYIDVAADAGMTLAIDIDTNATTTIEGDRQLLLQMLSNLVENAIRHCTMGSHILLALVATQNDITVSVADNGPGIPAEERTKVLQRLYRLEQSRTTEGSGLGLAMVKAIVDLHHADLELGSNAPGLVVSVSFRRSGPRP